MLSVARLENFSNSDYLTVTTFLKLHNSPYFSEFSPIFKQSEYSNLKKAVTINQSEDIFAPIMVTVAMTEYS